MSADLSVSLDEIAREGAELLPSRETLNVFCHPHGTHGLMATQMAGNSPLLAGNSPLLNLGLGDVNILDGNFLSLL